MSDSARNRANGFETLGGNKNNFNKQFSTGGKAPNPFKSGGSGNSTA